MLGAVFLWSSATPGTKSALSEIALADFVIIRLSLAAVALWVIVLVTRTSASLLRAGWRPLIMGLLEPGLVTLLVSLGLTMTSPVSASVFWGLTPLIMPILGRVVLGERIEFVVLVAAVIAFSGTLILVWGQSHHGGGSVLGDICVASGVLASAVNALLSRRHAQAGANPLVTSSWQLTSACCVALLLPFLIPPGPARALDASMQSIAVLAYLGLVVSVGVYILSNYAIRHLPVARMSLLGCLTAPFGAMLSAFLLKIEVSTFDVFGVGLVVGAVALPSLAQWMRKSPNWLKPSPRQKLVRD
ncbi:MAG TPA: DMT family transporter [Hyphomicrobiaceae bacterium]|jgi:drug/metabolite transporter (DMT)-like permease